MTAFGNKNLYLQHTESCFEQAQALKFATDHVECVSDNREDVIEGKWFNYCE